MAKRGHKRYHRCQTIKDHYRTVNKSRHYKHFKTCWIYLQWPTMCLCISVWRKKAISSVFARSLPQSLYERLWVKLFEIICHTLWKSQSRFKKFVWDLFFGDCFKAVEELHKSKKFLSTTKDVEEEEHSLEMHLPFIIKTFGKDVTLVPIMVGFIDD